MVSTLNLEEKFNRVRKNFCFYLDVEDHELSRSLSRRLQDMGLQQEIFVTSRVTHVVSDRTAGGGAAVARCSAGRARADAMLRRLRPPPRTLNTHPHIVHLTVQKAICLLDKLYDTFFTAPRKSNVRVFNRHFIKIEFLDKPCRPVFKEFNEWPEISLEPDPPKEKKKETPVSATVNNNNQQSAGQKMTRKSRPRIKDREEKEPKGGYCEMCNADYVDAAIHRRSSHHLAFVKDHANFLSLDSLINSGADVASFLDKSTPINGERRSLRKVCNGEVEPKTKRMKRSQTPESPLNGNESPKRNGGLEDEKKHNTRCSKKTEEDRQYYKVVGVSTKLRSSGGFAAKRKESPPTCNGAKPLVVKFRKVRRSELSVLSDEAEQFMFPKRASSSDSSSSEEEEEESPPRPPLSVERRRLARPVALKEESSEEDMWPEDTRRRKRKGVPVAKRGRRVPLRSLKAPETPPPDAAPLSPKPTTPISKTPTPIPENPTPVPENPTPVPETPTPVPETISPLREETDKCMKWEEGRLKYTPAVEQLEFAFECVPRSEPWYATFKRQDQDRVVARNIPQYFELYSKSPKLPYEIGQLPPLKPNCCPLSDLVKREEKSGPSRSYGTRGMKKQRIRKRTTALLALEAHPRKSPREHASTLAILGSAGLLHRRKHADDAKSTASEDTISDTHSNLKVEPVVSEMKAASERLQQFLSEVFDDAADFEVSEEAMDGEPTLTTSTNVPDVSSLVSECENCDIIRNEIKEGVESRSRGRRGKFKKKNRTGWPKKRRPKKDSRTNSSESEKKSGSAGRSSAELDDETTQDTISEDNSETDEKTELKTDDDDDDKTLIQVQEKTRAKAREKALYDLHEESVDYSHDKSLDKSRDKTLDNYPVKLRNKSFDKSPERSREKSRDISLDKSPGKVRDRSQDKSDVESLDKSYKEDQPCTSEKNSPKKVTPRSSGSETDDNDGKKKKRALAGLLLQPVVRVARVEAGVRTLRSAVKPRGRRGKGRHR